MSDRTVVHLLRHGEVHNPTGVLYGRLPDFCLSQLGREMAQRAADALADRDIVAVWSSPLDRARETSAPMAESHGLEIGIDERIIEAANVFEGHKVSGSAGALRQPKYWRHLRDPFTPSWGEPYKQLAARVQAAVSDARDANRGHEVVLVSHQLPIWSARLAYEDRKLWHDPRKRQCNLASLTSLVFDDERLAAIVYTEPSADLVKRAKKGAGA